MRKAHHGTASQAIKYKKLRYPCMRQRSFLLSHTTLRWLLTVLAALLWQSCKEDVQNVYTNIPAYFVCKTVSTVAPLNAALNGLGVFATIRYDRGQFIFTDASGKSVPTNATAIAGNSTIQMGIAGFIVGLPALPDMNSGTSSPICFDLACPHCYSQMNISRSMSIDEAGKARCKSCESTFDLNNQGMTVGGPSERGLYRYPITYSGNTVIISNQ